MGRAPRIVAGVVIGIVVVVGAALWLRSSDDESNLEHAASIVDDDDRWTTGVDSAAALGAVADLLQADAEKCAASQAKPRCDPLYEAAGWALASAGPMPRCTQPRVAELRRGAAKYLRALETGRAADPPTLVIC